LSISPTLNVQSVLLGKGCKLESRLHIPNAYVFCTSVEIIKDKFGEGHYEITNHKFFTAMLCKQLRKEDPRVYYCYSDTVIYRDIQQFVINCQEDKDNFTKMNITETQLADYFRKPLGKLSEKEYRFIFLIKTQNIPEYTDFNCALDEINQCCRC